MCQDLFFEMGESLCRSIQIQIQIHNFPTNTSLRDSSDKGAADIWGGFYVLSVLASNSSFLRSNYFEKVF